MKQLNYVQKKLLKKVDLFNYKNENTVRESSIIARFQLKNHEEYRQYNKLVGKVTTLVTDLRKMPSDNSVRIQITKELIDRLYRMGVIRQRESLERLEKLSVSSFCRRRIVEVLKRLKMAQHTAHAIQLVEQGHIRIGSQRITDSATFITRDMEDIITWAEGSKYKAALQDFADERDDFDLMNL